MTAVTKEFLEGSKDTDEWRDLYLKQGAEMLQLARDLLSSGKDQDIELGLKIIENAWFEEDEENPDTQASLSQFSFASLEASLEVLLANTAHAEHALYCLWVCCREGAKLSISPQVVIPFLHIDSKEKLHGMTSSSLAFRVLFHIYGQSSGLDKVMLLMKSASLKKVLLDEAGSYAAHEYDMQPLINFAAAQLQAKGESTVRDAVTMLRTIQKSGGDISTAVPYLVENQIKLAMYTDVVAVIAGYYLAHKKYDEFEAWLRSEDSKASMRAARGLHFAMQDGFSATDFLQKPGIHELVDSISWM